MLNVVEDQRDQWAVCIPGLEGHIVQWNADPKTPKAAWLVTGGKRYWIPDAATYECLRSRGAPSPDVLGAHALDWIPDQPGIHAQCTPPAPANYEGHIVQWDADPNQQRAAWLVRAGKRYWIPDGLTYQCLVDRGAVGPTQLPAAELDRLPDQSGVWGACS